MDGLAEEVLGANSCQSSLMVPELNHLRHNQSLSLKTQGMTSMNHS